MYKGLVFWPEHNALKSYRAGRNIPVKGSLRLVWREARQQDNPPISFSELRLNLPPLIVAYLFGVSVGYISVTNTWICSLHWSLLTAPMVWLFSQNTTRQIGCHARIPLLLLLLYYAVCLECIFIWGSHDAIKLPHSFSAYMIILTNYTHVHFIFLRVKSNTPAITRACY